MAGSNDHSIQRNSIIQQYMLVLEHLQVCLKIFLVKCCLICFHFGTASQRIFESPCQKKTREIKCINCEIDSFSFYEFFGQEFFQFSGTYAAACLQLICEHLNLQVVWLQ